MTHERLHTEVKNGTEIRKIVLVVMSSFDVCAFLNAMLIFMMNTYWFHNLILKDLLKCSLKGKKSIRQN